MAIALVRSRQAPTALPHPLSPFPIPPYPLPFMQWFSLSLPIVLTQFLQAPSRVRGGLKKLVQYNVSVHLSSAFLQPPHSTNLVTSIFRSIRYESALAVIIMVTEIVLLPPSPSLFYTFLNWSLHKYSRSIFPCVAPS